MAFSLSSGAALLFFGLSASCALAQASGPVPNNLLPARFSGWVEEGSAKSGTAANEIDAANADVLNEFGLKDFSEGTYRHGSGRAHVRAMRFADATGAYGAYTFFRRPAMTPMAIGDGGAASAGEVVFRAGDTVLDATFPHTVQYEERALRALAAELPPSAGSSDVAPSLPQYLPPAGLDTSTVHYAIGPVAYARMGGVLPPAVIDFAQDAETVTAGYSRGSDHATLTIVEYPTPQIAIQRAKKFDAILKGTLPPALQQGNPADLAVKRSGPLVAMIKGNMQPDQARALLDDVKYQAEVSFSRARSSPNEVKNAAEMLIGIAYLTGILAACAILLAAFFGGGRAYWRVLRGKPASTLYEEDFIVLNLSGRQ